MDERNKIEEFIYNAMVIAKEQPNLFEAYCNKLVGAVETLKLLNKKEEN